MKFGEKKRILRSEVGNKTIFSWPKLMVCDVQVEKRVDMKTVSFMRKSRVCQKSGSCDSMLYLDNLSCLLVLRLFFISHGSA